MSGTKYGLDEIGVLADLLFMSFKMDALLRRGERGSVVDDLPPFYLGSDEGRKEMKFRPRGCQLSKCFLTRPGLVPGLSPGGRRPS